jgi:hypothetical protein
MEQPLFGAGQEFVARRQRVRVGHYDLIEHPHHAVDSLPHHRTHGVYVEIERPPQWHVRPVLDVAHLRLAIEALIRLPREDVEIFAESLPAIEALVVARLQAAVKIRRQGSVLLGAIGDVSGLPFRPYEPVVDPSAEISGPHIGAVCRAMYQDLGAEGAPHTWRAEPDKEVFLRGSCDPARLGDARRSTHQLQPWDSYELAGER